MGEEIDISRRITVSHPDRSVLPPYPQDRAVTSPAEDRAPSTGSSGPSCEPPASFVRLGPDEVVIKKAVLRGIKRGAKLALEGRVPAAFSMGLASAGDVPFAIPKPSKDEVHLVKTMREHRVTHRGPFPCPVEDCPATFSLPKRHNRHLREKHGFDSRRN